MFQLHSRPTVGDHNSSVKNYTNLKYINERNLILLNLFIYDWDSSRKQTILMKFGSNQIRNCLLTLNFKTINL